jgi:hypothetical protein
LNLPGLKSASIRGLLERLGKEISVAGHGNDNKEFIENIGKKEKQEKLGQKTQSIFILKKES